MATTLLNWAGNLQFQAAQLHRPESVEAVQALVRTGRPLHALGTRHSFNPIADLPGGELISLERLDEVIALDEDRRTVTVQAGVRYGQLGPYLHERGFALHNLASLPHISVVGACATATHGSGDRNGNLATAIRGLELVDAHAERVWLRDPESIAGAAVGLGGLGIVTAATLAIEPTFSVRQFVFEALPLATAIEHFDAITGAAYSVSLFTRWREAKIDQVWLKRRVGADADDPLPDPFFGATPAPEDRHPIVGVSAENCTPQRGIPGPWHTRLPHFRMEFTPSCGDELQSEYFVPRARAADALRAVAALGEILAPHLLVSEIRTIAADTLWMSPCYEQACVALHFTWKPDGAAVAALLPQIEAALAPLGARPHWGKLFTLAPEAIAAGYPRIDDFRTLLRAHDPSGRFRNPFLNAAIFGAV